VCLTMMMWHRYQGELDQFKASNVAYTTDMAMKESSIAQLQVAVDQLGIKLPGLEGEKKVRCAPSCDRIGYRARCRCWQAGLLLPVLQLTVHCACVCVCLRLSAVLCARQQLLPATSKRPAAFPRSSKQCAQPPLTSPALCSVLSSVPIYGVA
jgi:hypothetical protein